MADNDKAPEEAKERELHLSDIWRRRRREVLVGAACCLGLVGLGGYLLYRATAPAPASVVTQAQGTVGLIDMQKVVEAHPDYAQLEELRHECRLLELETSDVTDLFRVEPPQVDDKPFDDSVWQKNAHDVIGRRAELERRKKKLQQDYAKEIEPRYTARRQAIEEEYQNVLVNLNLKIDNQKSMHNFRDGKEELASELAGWEQQREQLQRQRGAEVRELEQQRLAEIAYYVREQMGPELAAWRAELPELQEQQRSEATLKESEAQSRDTEAIQKQLDTAQAVQERLAKRAQLQDKQNELAALEAKIYNDISGRAAKIAILHHLTLIMADKQTELTELAPAGMADYAPARLVPPPTLDSVIGIDTIDVTDELVAEMQTLAPDN